MRKTDITKLGILLIVIVISYFLSAQETNKQVLSSNSSEQLHTSEEAASVSKVNPNETCEHQDLVFNCVKFVSNYDGDSITVTIPGVHPFFGTNAKVRVKGIDTPELQTKDQCEKEKARIAKKLVHNILKNAERIDLVQIEAKQKLDKYGRILADVSADGSLISSVLLKNGLAYTYQGKTKPKVNWCQTQREIASKYNL